MMPRENVPKSTDVIADAQVCQTRLVPFLDEDSYSVRSEAMQLRVVIGQLGLGWGGAPPRRGAVAILSIEWRPSSYIYQGNVGHPGVKWSAPKAEERGETPN